MVLKIQFHNVFEKDSLLEANLRKAPKITHKVFHPGNCKQNVPITLGHAAKKDDGKPEFCLAITDFIENWGNERVPSFEQFTLSLSTAKALI